MLSPFLMWSLLSLFVLLRICVSTASVQLLGRHYGIPMYKARMFKVPRLHIGIKYDRSEADPGLNQSLLDTPAVDNATWPCLRLEDTLRQPLTHSVARLKTFRRALIPAALLLLDGIAYYVLIATATGRTWTKWGDILWIIWVIVSVVLMLSFALWFLYRGRSEAQGRTALARAARCICGGGDNGKDPSADPRRHTITPELEAPQSDRQEINDGAGWLRNTATFNAGQMNTFRLMIMAGVDASSPVPPDELSGGAGLVVTVDATTMTELTQAIMDKLQLDREVVLCEKDEDTDTYASYEQFDFKFFPRRGKFHLQWKDEVDRGSAAPELRPDSQDAQLLHLEPDIVSEPEEEEEEQDSVEEWLRYRYQTQDRPTVVGGIVSAALGCVVAVMFCECGVVDWNAYEQWLSKKTSGHFDGSWTEAVVAGLFGSFVGFVGSRSEKKFIARLIKLANFGPDARADARGRVRYMLLVFCQVGYVFLVSSSLEPLTCTKDVDKKWYMVANPVL